MIKEYEQGRMYTFLVIFFLFTKKGKQLKNK